MVFDLRFISGATRGPPAMVPVAMAHDTPDNAAAEIAHLKARGYPVSYVEMGEEADGQYCCPKTTLHFTCNGQRQFIASTRR